MAVAGSAALGWLCRMPGGASAAATSSFATPMILLGVGIVLAPALYIGLSFAGAQTTTPVFVRGLSRALRATGITALGLAPPVLFLVATSTSEGAAFVFGGAALLLSVAVGLVTLAKYAADHSTASFFCFWAWAMAAGAVGGHFFVEAVLR